ncbi:MAG: hypothetical protein KC609_19210 [Myxococcales bacterium]|nr:hypothetical protein [Myxococcales bacterium]
MSNDSNSGEKTLVETQLPAHLLEEIERYERELAEKRKREQQSDIGRDTLPGPTRNEAPKPDPLLGFQTTQDMKSSPAEDLAAPVLDDTDGADDTLVAQSPIANKVSALERHVIGAEKTAIAPSPLAMPEEGEALFELPDLHPLPFSAEDCFPGAAPSAFIGAPAYALRFRKATSKLNQAGKILTERGAALSDKKQDILTAVGATALEAGFSHPDTAAFEGEVAQMSAALQQHEEAASSLQAQYDAAERDFRERNKDKLATRDAAEQTMQQCETQLKLLVERLRPLEKEANQARKGLEAAKNKAEKIKNAAKKAPDWEAQVNTLYQEMAQHQSQLESLDPQERALKAQVEQLNGQNQAAKQQFDSLKAELAAEEKKLEAETKGIAGQISGQEEEIRRLRQAMRDAQARVGFHLWSNAQSTPQYVHYFTALDRVAQRLEEDKQQLVAFEDVRSRLDGDVAKKGLIILIGAAFGLLGIIILLALII